VRLLLVCLVCLFLSKKVKYVMKAGDAHITNDCSTLYIIVYKQNFALKFELSLEHHCLKDSFLLLLISICRYITMLNDYRALIN